MTAKGLPPAAHALSGAVGGAFATWLFYPLELLRVEIQKTPPPPSEDDETIKNCNEPTETNLECFIRLYKKQALYRGASAMVTTMLISSYITFFALESIRRSMANLKQGGQQSNRQQLTRQMHQLRNHIKFINFILPKSKMGSSLLASTLTGIINVFLTTPLWNGTRRIMESDPQPSKPISSTFINNEKQMNAAVLPLRVDPNLWEMMYQIANDEGILQLWHGTVSSLLLVSNPAIQYFLYEQIRVWVLGMKNRRGSGSSSGSLQLTAMEAFAFGALSKTVATVITYPLQLGQVLIRLRKNEVKELEQADPSNMTIEEYSGMTDCLYQQYTRGGFSSLFQGMSSKLVQTVGQASFIFVTYEQMLALVAKVIEPQ